MRVFAPLVITNTGLSDEECLEIANTKSATGSFGGYLNSLRSTQSKAIVLCVIDVAEALWLRWRQYGVFDTLADGPFTFAGPRHDGGMELCWNTSTDHVSIDILPDGTVEWFHAKPQNQDWLDGDEGIASIDLLPADLLETLKGMS